MSACRGADSTPQRKTFIDSRDRYDPRSLDPALSTDVPTGRAVSYLFDGLTQFTVDAHLAPALAERWDVSSDGRTYTFHLRPGVTFHDGRAFHASDVVYSFQRVLDPRTKGGRGWPLYPISGARAFAAGTAPTISGLAAPDDSTIRITLDTALAIFPKLLAMPVASILPAADSANFAENPVGTGPWRFVRWKHDDYVLLARNPSYWGGAPHMDSLEIRIVPEPSTSVAEFQAGNVDLLYVPEAETERWEHTDEKSAFLVSAPALRLWYVAINCTRGPLKDPRVRQALNYAVDVPTMLQRLVGGRGTLAAGVIPPSLDGSDKTRTPYPYDTARARALLTAAGYPKGFAIQLWVGQDETFQRLAQSIQAYLAAVGVRVSLVQRDNSAAREAARHGDADLIIKDWYADYPDAEDFLDPLLVGANRGVGGNVSFYENPMVDQLVARARTTADDAQRAALYQRADSIAFGEAPMIYLFFYNELYAVQPWIRDFKAPAIFNGQRFLDVRIAGPGTAPAASGVARDSAAPHP